MCAPCRPSAPSRAAKLAASGIGSTATQHIKRGFVWFLAGPGLDHPPAHRLAPAGNVAVAATVARWQRVFVARDHLPWRGESIVETRVLCAQTCVAFLYSCAHVAAALPPSAGHAMGDSVGVWCGAPSSPATLPCRVAGSGLHRPRLALARPRDVDTPRCMRSVCTAPAGHSRWPNLGGMPRGPHAGPVKESVARLCR